MKRRALFFAVVLAAIASHVQAQDYPTRVITLVSPFPPGGPSDTSARLVTGPMSQALGQQIVVDNLTGAGGVIGTDHVAKAAPDGYTLIVSGSGTHAAAEFLKKDLPYRSTDFEQIGLINTSPMIVAARSGVPADTLKDFIAYLKANEKKVTEADAGVGSISNLACSVFHALADVHPTVASYRGTPEATMDLVRGNVDFGCNQIVNITPHIKSGALKAFAVTSDKRSPMLPDVPTTAEAGMPDFNLTVWFGLSAPKGTPRAIVDKLNGALGTALDDPDVVARFADLGYAVVPKGKRSAAYFDKFYNDEVALWAKVLGGLHTKSN
ncbi:MAG TPA: tripartite tricarboxylate transporter substrate binding protein [Xanthobacteraceae bacterium]|jgi:tripartite-type tricarboxylate transporter receptor subunit TctC|nr:tripartite tricarboxylate transporter substrate binding protein [Xanthobacteraceae bacterium]